MIETAIEELEHFQEVFELMQSRGVPLNKEMKEDLYIKQLMPLTHGGTNESRFLSRLLMGSIVECRGCERFKMVSEAHEDPSLKSFTKPFGPLRPSMVIFLWNWLCNILIRIQFTKDCMK